MKSTHYLTILLAIVSIPVCITGIVAICIYGHEIDNVKSEHVALTVTAFLAIFGAQRTYKHLIK